MRHGTRLFAVILSVGSIAAAQPVPPELSALAAKARLEGPVTAWCRGEFRSRHPRAFAVAITSAAGGGRYAVLEMDATVTELGSFTRGADLSCYTRAEARKLNVAIGHSETIQGHLTPRWSTTVVCAFVDPTTSVCWQYSPSERAFVEVGRWTT
ncbi:MAG: hypothetical protein QOJ80_1401 [Mycobacterium sp.]|nr:hypothetical protein [Mycobacterium sp.]